MRVTLNRIRRVDTRGIKPGDIKMINSYNFGKMVIDGKKYSSDLIIFQEVVWDSWWRNKGHELCIADIKQAVEDFTPSTIVVGTGKFGMMKILPETEEYLKSQNINLIVQKSENAALTYNKLFNSEKVLGAFHLTC